jgi:putative ABC transport system permease protein
MRETDSVMDLADRANFLSRLVCFIKIILQGIWINRFQLLLTTFTMSIGSLGLALTIFLGDGALGVMWADLEELLGSWTVVGPDHRPENKILKTRQSLSFTQQDLDGLKQQLPMARMVTPAVFNQMAKVRTRNREGNLYLDAITDELAQEKIFQPVHGRALSPEAYAGLNRECMVSEKMIEAYQINLENNPTLLINDHLFKVVGVVRPLPLYGDRFPLRVVVPYIYARTLWMGPGDIGTVVVAWHDTSQMNEIIERIRSTLDNSRGPETYFLSSKQYQIQSGRKIVRTFIVVGTTQSIFCIFIASIGVLNVMLTNVARRTHEFAIRIAMGARQRDILMVVLAESICVGLLGAFIGLLLAVFIAPIIGDLMASGIQEASQLQPDISLKGMVQPLLICGLCSLFAGVIPALKVRNVDILAALRKNV